LIDEIKIIQDCLAGDVERFEHIVKKYQTLLLRTAFHFLGCWDDAKDATQTTFIKAYGSLYSFRPECRFSTWLYRILVNDCLDRLKSAHRRYRTSLENPIRDESKSNPLDQMAAEDFLYKALRRLPDKRRRAFILVDLEGFSGPEAAEILGCSDSTVRVALMKARQQLRKIYIELSDVSVKSIMKKERKT